jgi:hypothetical protein
MSVGFSSSLFPLLLLACPPPFLPLFLFSQGGELGAE